MDPCLQDNGGCQQRCTSYSGGEAVCQCYAGYQLTHDKRTCIGKKVAMEIIICVGENHMSFAYILTIKPLDIWWHQKDPEQ